MTKSPLSDPGPPPQGTFPSWHSEGNGAIRVFSGAALAVGLGCAFFGVTGRRFFYHYRSPHAPPADMDPRQAHESHEPR